jgi:uncharacterized protein
MQRRNGQLVYSPSDLIEFVESRFASAMSRLALDRPELAPEPDETSRVLARHGRAFEQRVLDGLRAEGRDVVRIAPGADGLERTLEAMRAGRGVIAQAQLERPPFFGIADFLVRVERASALGAHAYEVWDAKLARRAKPYFLIQLCAYAEMIARVQGAPPDEVGVWLGSGRLERFRTVDFAPAARAVERAFLDFMDRLDPAALPLPDPSADHRGWRPLAERTLEELDHVSRVAGARGSHAQRLAAAGIETLSALATTTLERVPGIASATLARLREQAELQLRSRGAARPLYRVIPARPERANRGLAALPPASPNDVGFDLEGYPLAEGGLEYLWGIHSLERGQPRYDDWWAHDPEAERRALEGVVDFLLERRRRDPTMHVYHYAAYEVQALRRLAGRHGTREDQVDELLRSGAFVDLLAIVRESVRVGEPSYSLKNVERLYRGQRGAGVKSGLDSVVFYERWLESGQSPDWRESPLLGEIRAYNREDCESTLELARWLAERQAEHGIAWTGGERATPAETPAPETQASVRSRAQRELAARMLAQIPTEASARVSERWAVQELLAQLVEFHHREARPTWWSLFHRRDLDPAGQLDDPDCLAGAERTKTRPFPIRASRGFEYRFDAEQDTKLEAGDTVLLAENTDVSGVLHRIDPVAGRAVVKLGPSALARLHGEAPASACWIRFEHVRTGPIEDSIAETAARFLESGELPPALEDVLLRRPPRLRARPRGGPLVAIGEDASAAVARLAGELESSALLVQGPPGTGKTSSAARAIALLLARGQRVGIASNSHKAILNLMGACARAAGSVCAIKVGGDPDDPLLEECGDVEWVSGAEKAAALLPERPLVGGTAWCFSHPSLEGALDVLFVDEAGQVSLANLVGMARSAKSLVLVGDQMQLAQPVQGSHPGESGRSALDYLLKDHATIPPERGVFLDRTHRLHPAICGLVSQMVYEGRLAPAPDTVRRVLRVPGSGARLAPSEAGIVFVPVAHEGNRQASDEEAAAVRELVDELLGRELYDVERELWRPLALDDILVVAPYNSHVRRLRGALGPQAQVGSVDLFQGQQAPVVIVSLGASDARGARGVEFLLSRNRLNVAISRAQSLAFVVANPALALTPASSVEELRLVSLFCRVVEEGSLHAARR